MKQTTFLNESKILIQTIPKKNIFFEFFSLKSQTEFKKGFKL